MKPCRSLGERRQARRSPEAAELKERQQPPALPPLPSSVKLRQQRPSRPASRETPTHRERRAAPQSTRGSAAAPPGPVTDHCSGARGAAARPFCAKAAAEAEACGCCRTDSAPRVSPQSSLRAPSSQSAFRRCLSLPTAITPATRVPRPGGAEAPGLAGCSASRSTAGDSVTPAARLSSNQAAFFSRGRG